MIRTRGERIFNVINIVLVALITSTCLLPFIHILAKSFSANTYLLQKEVFFWPKGFTLNSYQYVLSNPQFFRSLINSVFITVAGTVLSMLVTVLTAFVFTRNELPFQKLIVRLFIFTMFFSGGMIPTYLVVSDLALLNTVWAVLLPSAITASHVIIVRTYFQSIPKDLTEAAFIDGCTNFQTFLHVVLPLSKAVIAVIALYVSSSLWNRYFEPMLYLSDRNLYPLQLFLRQILIQNDLEGADISAATIQEQQYISELIKYGVIIVSTLPMMLVYPFIQKYFVKGVMIGSIKG